MASLFHWPRYLSARLHQCSLLFYYKNSEIWNVDGYDVSCTKHSIHCVLRPKVQCRCHNSLDGEANQYNIDLGLSNTDIISKKLNTRKAAKRIYCDKRPRLAGV